MKTFQILVIFLLSLCFTLTAGDKMNYKPEEGYVPNAETAIKIAVAVWIPIYGKKQIESEKPYIATLKNGIWTVTGTLPKDSVGGTAIAEISKETGCILRIIHEK